MRLIDFIPAKVRDTLVVDGAKILAINVAGAGLAFISHVLFARWLSVASYGNYVYALSWFNILFIIIQAGLNLSMVRLIAEYRAHGNSAAMVGLISFSNAVVLILGGAVAVAGCSAVFLFRDDIGQELEWTLVVMLGLTTVMALLQQRIAVLQGLERVVESTLLFEILRPVLLLVAVWVIGHAGNLNSTIVMTTNLLVTAAVLICIIPYARSHIRCVAVTIEQTAPHWRDWLKVSLPYVAVAGITIILTQMDVLMIGAILGPEQAALYNPAAKVALLAIFPVVAIRARLAPMAVTLFAEHRIDALQNRITTATVASTAACLCLLIVIIFWREPILSLFGDAYTAGGPVIIVLATGYLVYSLAGAVEMFFLVGPFERLNALVVLASLGLNFTLNLALIPTHGMIGAAWATVGAVVLRAVASIAIVFHRTRLTPLARTRGDL